MRFDLRPDTPRPLAQCGATVAPGQDARWRGTTEDRADGVAVRTAQLREERRIAIERRAERRIAPR